MPNVTWIWEGVGKAFFPSSIGRERVKEKRNRRREERRRRGREAMVTQ